MKQLHPAIIPIVALLLTIGVVGGVIATYRSYGQKKAPTEQSVKYEAPKWKTRQVWRDGKYIQETYRDMTEADRVREMKHQEELMKIKGRL